MRALTYEEACLVSGGGKVAPSVDNQKNGTKSAGSKGKGGGKGPSKNTSKNITSSKEKDSGNLSTGDLGDDLVLGGIGAIATGATLVQTGSVLAAADGPLPFGDVIGAPIAAVGTVSIVGGIGSVGIGAAINVFD